MEIRTLVSFAKIAEIGNYTRAAESLGYTQSTLTSHIQQLEKELGVSLFDKIGKKLILTNAGRELLPYANQMISLSETIQTIGSNPQDKLHGNLRIGVTEGIMSSFFINIVTNFYKEYPGVFIQVIPGISKKLIDMLRHNEVDIVFTMGEINSLSDCILATSHAEKAVFVTTPKHELANAGEVEISKVLEYPMILNGSNTLLQQEIYKRFVQYNKEVKTYIQCASPVFQAEFIKRCDFVGFITYYYIEKDIKNNELIEINVKNYSFNFFINVFYHRSKWVTPEMNALIKITKEYWKNNP